MPDSSSVTPYGSAGDLPSVQEMEQQLASFESFSSLLPKDSREQLNDLAGKLRQITQTVDRFYELLGERNWVFTDNFNLPAIEQVISTSETTIAEARLIEYYKTANHIAFSILRLRRLDAMKPRIELLEKALDDYKAGRYYSTVLVLLSVMDGFVNDLDKSARKGLHTRGAEDMVAWDSMAGHHLGLAHAHQSFTKGCYKTDTGKVTDLFRHGIMHGTLVNFDNDVVATKAWNRLFAICDWAEARKRHAEPSEPAPSLDESLKRYWEAQRQNAKLDEWQPFEYEPSQNGEDPSEVATRCEDFLEAWHKKRWNLVGGHFISHGDTRPSANKLAVEAKSLYSPLSLSSWKILRVRHVAMAIAHADVELRVDDSTYQTDLRWVRVDESGTTSMDGQGWALSLYGPSHFLKPEKTIPAPKPDS